MIFQLNFNNIIYFTISSSNSLIKLTTKTNTNGAIAVEGSIGEIRVMDVNTAVNKKKQLK